MRKMLMAFALLLVALLYAPPAQAQPCGDWCGSGWIFGCCPTNEHMWTLNDPGGERTGETTHDCQIVGAHGTCFPDEEAEVQLAYRSVLDATAAGDVVSALRHALWIPDYVEVSRERDMLLIKNCSGSNFIGSISLNSSANAEAQVLLAALEAQTSDRRALAAFTSIVLLQ